MKRILLIRGGKANGYARTLHEIGERAENPPLTWAPYKGKRHGLFEIIEMEHAELQAMRESGTHPQVVKELVDLAAACMCAAHKMTCPEDNDHD